MNEIVTFYEDQEEWYHAYATDAVVISNIIGYKLYLRYNGFIAIGFPKEYLKKVTSALAHYNIGYAIDNEIITKYENSKYIECLKSEYVKNDYVFYETSKYITKTIIKGTFTIQFNEEEPISREIGVDIDPDAKIIEFVANNNEGDILEYGEDIVKIISKNLKTENI